MIGRTRRPRLMWLLVAAVSVALLAAACDDNGNGNGEEPNGTVPDAPEGPGDPADDAFPGQPDPDPAEPDDGNANDAGEANTDGAAGADEVNEAPALDLDPIASASLEPVGESNTTGLVELAEHEGATALDATITGLPEGDHFGRVYSGSCDESGDLAFDLGEIERDNDGAAPFIVGIDAPVENVADAHVFTVEDETDEVIACAEFFVVEDAVPDGEADAPDAEDGADGDTVPEGEAIP